MTHAGRRPTLSDTHCHLMLAVFDADRDEVLARAQAEGVDRILMPGIDLETSRRGVELASTHECLFAAVGIHPHEASSWSEQAAWELSELAQAPKVVAIGETGLDFYRMLAPREQQEAALQGQLEIAAEVGLPVVLHQRDSMDRLLEMVEAWASSQPARRSERMGVFHAFGGTVEQGRRAIESGFFVGFGGQITYPNASVRRESAASLPLERILIETDAPYLAPQAHRGERNEPGFVRHVAEQLGTTLGIDYTSVTVHTYDNAAELFNWNDGTDDSDLL